VQPQCKCGNPATHGLDGLYFCGSCFTRLTGPTIKKMLAEAARRHRHNLEALKARDRQLMDGGRDA
jgi:hypothetical protein